MATRINCRRGLSFAGAKITANTKSRVSLETRLNKSPRRNQLLFPEEKPAIGSPVCHPLLAASPDPLLSF
jgi:hypothetical protein